MNNDNVAAVRNAYAVAERKDLEGWINAFTPDGVFTDNSMGVVYRGRALADVVVNYVSSADGAREMLVAGIGAAARVGSPAGPWAPAVEFRHSQIR